MVALVAVASGLTLAIFLKAFGGGRRASRQTGPARGNDLLTRVRINFMDAINGTKIEFMHTYDKMCETCQGKGAENANDIHTCSKCNGSGLKPCPRKYFRPCAKSKSVHLVVAAGKQLVNRVNHVMVQAIPV